MNTNLIGMTIFSVSIFTSAALAAEQPVAASGVMPSGHNHTALSGVMGTEPMGKSGSWTTLPILKTKMSGPNRENTVITAVPLNIVPGNVDAYSNNLKDTDAHRQLAMGLAGAKLDKPATGGFQLLIAREEQTDSVRVASTVYYFGERGAKNPTDMFMLQKNELEIIPQPYPREHSRYRANEDWKFLVRYNSQPLATQKVNLETSNGSKFELLTDASGVLNLHVPNDFKPVDGKQQGGGHDHGVRRGADFVLAVEHLDAGKNYLTTFNSTYGADAYDNRNLAMGLGFTLLGMVGAVPLLRKKKSEKKAGSPSEKKEEV